ncbi:heterokaryon incompatibility protein-domain-containing protein [Podospora aff. communis PSN243]|uniref:Heterokaryon incompatibility protein-domain-containing protein n=1 Tax=Podospora aff. communis PSN243 TaxID=3040156 RepID=A0AAV9GLD5_9PEZI|nr:heterokaryon incompatibility protein-domain-containing protein [Podospora aff. communis PSN243]
MGNVQFAKRAHETSGRSEPPVANVTTDQEKIVKIGPPPADLRQQCEGWTKIATFHQVSSHNDFERQAESFHWLWIETKFRTEPNCCVVCWTLCKCMVEIGCQSTRTYGEVSLSVFDDVYVDARQYPERFRFIVPSGVTSPWKHLFPGPPDRAPLTKIQWVVTRCDTLHGCYDAQSSKTTLPTRVLDVSGGPASIHLRESRGLRERYITLSHCWGSKLPLQTNTGNIEEYRQNIPWDMIHVVYKKAIKVCWELKVAYIWIDSLCIIQDSKDDWVEESQKMCDTYANAYLTVAATSSPDCSVSMMNGLAQRPPEPTVRLIVTGAEGTREHSLSCYLTKPGHWDTDRYGNIRGDSQNWPLKSRAWAFQESMLSPRLVHLTPTDIVWQCRRAAICNCEGATDLGDIAAESHREMEMDLERPCGEQQIAELWRRVVEG